MYVIFLFVDPSYMTDSQFIVHKKILQTTFKTSTPLTASRMKKLLKKRNIKISIITSTLPSLI